MPTECAITGTLRDLTNTPLPNTRVTFSGSAVVGQYGFVVVPLTVSAETDELGILTVDLFPGTWQAVARTSSGRLTFSVAVPEETTADLADLIDAASPAITSTEVAEAREARDAAEADAIATAADRVQTGLDVIAAEAASVYAMERLEEGSTLSGYAFGLLDSSDRPAIAVTSAGVVEMPGTATFTATQLLESTISGIAWGVIDQDDRLAFAVTDAGDVLAKGAIVDLSEVAYIADISSAIDPTLIIDCWGDSLTHGNTSGVTVPYPDALAALLPGRTVNNYGKSGQTSLQIATTFGAVPSILTVTGNSIPASGAVTVTTTENGNFSSKSNFGTINATGALFGITGVLATGWNAGAPELPGTTTFTRSAAGMATTIPNRTPFILDTNDREANTVIIWSGRNDIYSGYANSVILANIAAQVAFLSPLRKRFIILSVTDATDEPSGSANHTQILALNYDLSKAYPRNFIDVRKILVNSYNPGEPADVTAFGTDNIPPSLSQDGIHLNDAGYAIVADAVADFITAKGW